MTTQMHPHDARAAARLASYPNQLAEREAIAAVDQEVFERVHLHEEHLVENARRFMSDAAVDMDAADQLETQMRQQVRYLLEDGASPAKVARDYQLLRRDAERAIETLNRAVTMADFHATVVRDPYKSYSDLMDKYEGLRPSLGG